MANGSRPEYMVWLDQAYESLPKRDIDLLYRQLDYGVATCHTAAERSDFFGVQGSPGNPYGVAALADKCVLSKKDLFTAYHLLRYIERNAGTGMGLCEVWFSFYLEALAQEDFPSARMAYDKCLESQSTSPYWRIGPEDLKNKFQSRVGRYSFSEFLSFSCGLPERDKPIVKPDRLRQESRSAAPVTQEVRHCHDNYGKEDLAFIDDFFKVISLLKFNSKGESTNYSRIRWSPSGKSVTLGKKMVRLSSADIKELFIRLTAHQQ